MVDGSGGNVAGVQYSRTRAGEVPATGSAGYSGDYAGVIVDANRVATPTTIKGTATMSANFASGTVDGTIGSRVYYPGTTLAGNSYDLTLSGATLDTGGNFAGGIATGGGIAAGADVTSGGSYEGLIGGTTADEIAVGVTIFHSDYPGPEIGAVVASTPTP